MRWLLPLLALVAAGCEKRTPMPTPEPVAERPDAGVVAPSEPIRVPEGCDLNLRGTWRFDGPGDHRYAITDDGERLVARPLDAGADEVGDAMVLERTPSGFVGEVLSSARTAGGRECQVSFPAEIVECGPRSITVRSADAVDLSEDCTQSPAETPPTDKILIRE
jgi:hypothetical protein